MQTKHMNKEKEQHKKSENMHTQIHLNKEQELHILLVPEGVWFSKVPLYYQHYYHHY